MSKTINDFKLLSDLLSDNLKNKQQIANYNIADADISGGRSIKNLKSNQLFTSRFEEIDVKNFLAIWSSYRTNNVYELQTKLWRAADSMIQNYRATVSPIEVMLYTSITITTSFRNNLKLLEETGRTVYLIWKKNPLFISSIEHIANIWQWPHVITICAIAVGYICSKQDIDIKYIELMRSIFNYHRHDEQILLGIFLGLINSKNEDFIPDILSIIHDLKGSDTDKIIANIFQNVFIINFPTCSENINGDIFWDSPIFARNVVRRFINYYFNEDSLSNRYNNTKNYNERNKLIEEALDMIRIGRRKGINDAVNMLRMASSSELNKRIYQMLNLTQKNKTSVKPIIKYFSYIRHQDAIDKISAVTEDSDYYALCRTALFKLNLISADDFIRKFLLETKNWQLLDYIDGFWGLPPENIIDLKTAILNFFNSFNDISQYPHTINNYKKLIEKYKHFYDEQIGELFKSYFGFNTVLGEIQIKIPEQYTCLNIFDIVANTSNYKRYEDFLYYIARENSEFSPPIKNYAQSILKKISNAQIHL